jgi:4a-hydroxytetrahydrobiopterin dehydratase
MEAMSAPASDELTRPEISAAIDSSGWRLVLGSLLAAVPVTALPQAVQVAGAAVAACGAEADDHLRVDVRADRVEFSLQSAGQTRASTGITARDLACATAIGDAMAGLGLSLVPPTGPVRPVQRLEICIDALDIAAVRPFWLAVLGMAPEPGHDGLTDAIVDLVWQLPAVWFQQMDEPRPQRNRIHFDIAVPHDEALRRVHAAVEAGGRVVDDAEAKAFWILADPEGNEVCVCTWQDRD